MIKKNSRPYILAVDDESDLLMLIKKSLASRGFDVATLLNAVDILDTVRDRPPDVILLDVQMNGINGADLCKQLKKDLATASILVVMLSAADDLAKVAKDSGADAFVSKPYSTEKIMTEIRRIWPELHLDP